MTGSRARLLHKALCNHLVVGAALCGAILLSSCARTGIRGTPVEPTGVIRMAEAENSLENPVHIVFGWSLTEPGMRVQGRGVARLEPPDRARLDLFTASGETVAAAAMVGSEMRLPPGTPDLIPPSALLWAVLGIFHPGEAATLLGGEEERDGQIHHLRYELPENVELRYVLREGVVGGAELLRGGRTIESVALAGQGGDEFPREATYRNVEAFRELKVTLESVENVEGFPSETWRPDR